MAPVEVRDLSKHFGDVSAVKNLSFEIEAGRVTGFLGPNGAGKCEHPAPPWRRRGRSYESPPPTPEDTMNPSGDKLSVAKRGLSRSLPILPFRSPAGADETPKPSRKRRPALRPRGRRVTGTSRRVTSRAGGPVRLAAERGTSTRTGRSRPIWEIPGCEARRSRQAALHALLREPSRRVRVSCEPGLPSSQPNQQFRVELMNPAAPVDSLAAKHVLARIFRTAPGDSDKLGPRTVTFDLSRWAGKKVRIRFAQVDNVGPLRAGVRRRQARGGCLPMTPALELHDDSRRADDDTAEVASNSRSLALDGLAVETRGLGKQFGSRAALHNVDLEVPRGCAFGFLGPNGAGKTTQIRLLLGLAEPTARQMRLLGRDLPGGWADALARVGAIIEEPRFHPHLTGCRSSHHWDQLERLKRLIQTPDQKSVS